MRKRTKGIIAAVSLVGVAVIVLISLYLNKMTATAGGLVTLPGIESIVLNNNAGNPFVIVEVVADKADASMGLLIKGEEPVLNGKALSDMPTGAERMLAMDSFAANYAGNSRLSSLATAGAISVKDGYTEYDAATETSVNYDVRGYFHINPAGDYTLKTPLAGYAPYDPSVHTGDVARYNLYVDVDFTAGGTYSASLKYIHSAADRKTTFEGELYPMVEAYSLKSVKYFSDIKVVKENDDDVLFKDLSGKYVYYVTTDAGGQNTYNFYGIIDADGNIKNTDAETVEPDTLSTTRYAVVEFETNNLGGDYAFANIAEVSYGGFFPYRHYEVADNGEYVNTSVGKPTYEYMPAFSPYVYDTENYEYYGPFAFISDSSYANFATVHSENGIENADWFKEYVFDLTESYASEVSANVKDLFNVNVVTLTVDELNSTDILPRASLLYLSGGSYTEDFTDSVAVGLLREAIVNKLPIVMDRSFGGMNNLDKVSCVLRQVNIENDSISNVLNGFWGENDIWNNSSNGLFGTVYDKPSYVNTNIFVYDDGAVPFISGDFKEAFSDTSGFAPVADEILVENQYRSSQGQPLVTANLSKATALRYIINFSKQRITTKTEVKVLEIEPCYSFGEYYVTGSYGYSPDNDLKHIYVPYYYNAYGQYHANKRDDKCMIVGELTNETLTADIVKSWINQEGVNSSTNVNLTQTYTKEFVGKVEDLNENYDLIYIGLDTTTMNTDVVNVNEYGDGNPLDYTGVKTNRTVYNDTSMNGKVYSHIGDLVDYSANNSDNKAKFFWPDKYGDYSVAHKYRLAGNDITVEKLNNLKEFIEAGYAVVFADDFFRVSINYDGTRNATVNTDRIDINSNMYKLGVFAADFINKNVFVRSDLEYKSASNATVLENFKTWLNVSKLTVIAKDLPVEYSNSGGISPVYLQSDRLSYTVELKNDAAIGLASTTYDVKLYIDTSVDGRFTELEEIPNLTIYEDSVSDANRVYQTDLGDGKTGYKLVAGKTYIIERTIPTGYVGMLPWKLIFTQNENALVRRALSGYTALPISSSQKETINVLQITSGAGYTNLDLTSQTVKDQMALVQDFNINVTVISSDSLITNYGTSVEDCYRYLTDYDMLIFGFTDMYQFSTGDATKNQNAANGVKEYINSGRSVLFTHDTTSFFNYTYVNIDGQGYTPEWGYYFNQNIRSAVGMDRFNVFNSANNTMFDTTVSLLTQGYSDLSLLRYISGNRYFSTCRPTSRGQRDGQYNETNVVTITNKGQITTYPFVIPDRLSVAKTHYQYYQLNLDTLSYDSNANDDIVVWYCISDIGGSETSSGAYFDDVYQMAPSDVRNNYYIYNKGNVTYSGVGHSSITNINELRLFINTMVAAYQAGLHPPKVVYHNADATDSLKTVYLPYDRVLNRYLDDETTLYFEITDSSFVQGTRSMDYKVELVTYSYEGTALRETRHPIDNEIFVYNRDKTLGASLGSSQTARLEFDKTYAIKFSTDDLNMTGTDCMPYVSLVISAQTSYNQNGTVVESGWGENFLSLLRVELFDLE